MEMYDPPSPGDFIEEVYVQPSGLSVSECALSLGISTTTLADILDGTQDITPEVALTLSQAFGRSPESWVRLQKIYDAWQLKVSAANNITK